MKKLKKFSKKYKNFLLGAFFVGILWDIFFIPNHTDKGMLLLIVLWYLITYLLKLRSTATLRLTLLLLVLLGFVYTFFHTSISLERLATWVYLFVLFALVQQFFEIRKSR
jgi:hypothetical protein